MKSEMKKNEINEAGGSSTGNSRRFYSAIGSWSMVQTKPDDPLSHLTVERKPLPKTIWPAAH